MAVFYYIIKQVLNCFRFNKPFASTSVYKGFKLYLSVKKDKKGLFMILLELDKLSWFWSAFPDCYFRFGMFMKEWNDIEKMKSFIPQEAYARLSITKDKRYNLLIDDKIIFHDIMTFYGLPVPERYFIFRENEFRKESNILSDNEVDEILHNISDERIFVKRFTGGAASGVSIFVKNNDGKYIDSDGDIVSAELIRNKYTGQSFIFEKQIKQERELSSFNPDTVNTIRVLTYKNKVISATVRFGGKGEYVDNVSANGVAVNLDINTGALGMYDIKKYYEHPDSHLKFEGTIVHQWPDVKLIVEQAMLYLPYYCSVGFDVATTDNGPIILEINTGAGINLSQIGKEYGLKSSFEAL